MELTLNIILPILVITAIAVIYILLLRLRHKNSEQPGQTKKTQRLPKTAMVVPYMETVLLDFHRALKQAIPEKYIVYANVPIEKLFEASRRDELQMKGQYADFVIFSSALMPILVIDLFDLSIINLERVNKIKNTSKEILRNSGIPVLDYQYTGSCNIDDLRRKIADLLNPLPKIKK